MSREIHLPNGKVAVISPHGMTRDFGRNVEQILAAATRVIKGRIPGEVRRELMTAVKYGVLGRLKKKRPQAGGLLSSEPQAGGNRAAEARGRILGQLYCEGHDGRHSFSKQQNKGHNMNIQAMNIEAMSALVAMTTTGKEITREAIQELAEREGLSVIDCMTVLQAGAAAAVAAGLAGEARLDALCEVKRALIESGEKSASSYGNPNVSPAGEKNMSIQASIEAKAAVLTALHTAVEAYDDNANNAKLPQGLRHQFHKQATEARVLIQQIEAGDVALLVGAKNNA